MKSKANKIVADLEKGLKNFGITLEDFYSVGHSSSEIFIHGAIDKKTLRGMLTRAFYICILMESGMELNLKNIKVGDPILSIEVLETLLLEKTGTAKMKSQIEESVEKSLDYYMKNINDVIKESVDGLFSETYTWAILDLNKSRIDYPTECQAFEELKEMRIMSIRERMGIKPARGNRKKSRPEYLLEIHEFFDSLKFDLSMANDILISFQSIKEKNRRLRTEDQWNEYKQEMLREVVHISPLILDRLESKERSHTPEGLALEITYKKFKLGSEEELIKLLKRKFRFEIITNNCSKNSF